MAPPASPRDALRVLSWDQDTTVTFVRVRVPPGTPAARVRVDARPRSLSVSLPPPPPSESSSSPHHLPSIPAPLRGALVHPCVASETIWTLEEDTVHIVLVKRHGGIQDPAWRSLFEGEEEKTIAQTLKELCDADERSPAHDDLPQETRDAVEETREMRYMMGCGEWRPDDDGVDGFRLVVTRD